MEHVHRRSWFFVGRADEVPAPGDYRAIDTAAGPVILLRDLAGELRAFANCCRHRGSRLLESSGNRRAIVCPYHGWGYRLRRQPRGCTGHGPQTRLPRERAGTPPPFPPIEGLSADARRGTYFSLILPTTQFALAQDSMWWLQVRPLAADRSILSLSGCFPKSVVARADFKEKAQAYYERWLRVAEEDVGMLEIQQVGLGSALHRPGLLSWREALVERIDRWVMSKIPETQRPR